ncbi:MAG TPA: glycoside hydrolase family 28 protein [Verrucomicrobiae bacterium]|nr:glycoside hydrolase family 28 protein [Verrucomicrobiae bacterium]
MAIDSVVHNIDTNLLTQRHTITTQIILQSISRRARPLRLYLLLSAAWLSAFDGRAADTAASDADAAAKIFDVRQFGALGDGTNRDTAAIQKALDECGKSGGVVHFGPGTYLCTPITLHSKTTLQLDAGATLLGTDEPEDYKNPERKSTTLSSASFLALINGKDLTDVTIAGPGTIDGAGARWWVPAEAARRKTPGFTTPRPRLILLTRCNNLRVQDITLQNSPSFHLVPTECENVVITNVTITAPSHSPNTDAIDPSMCKNVLITHCHIDVGDDNVAIKSGRYLPGREFACEDITVTDCTFLHGHGMSIGSETIGGVRNVIVRNCTFEGTENGIRIKSQRGKGGVVENIRFSDITMKNVDPAITFTCYYMNNSAGDAGRPAAAKEDAAVPVDNRIPLYRDIHISNLTATCQRAAGVINGLPDDGLITNVVFENVRITAATTGLNIRNARGIQFKDVQITPGEGPPLVLDNVQAEGLENIKGMP